MLGIETLSATSRIQKKLLHGLPSSRSRYGMILVTGPTG